MMENCKKKYEMWCLKATKDVDLIHQLEKMTKEEIEDSFYRDLAFGTGGLRGEIGAGTNRVNIYTVAKASQGLANYLKKNFEKPSVVIGFDSRRKSDMFAKTAASVVAANGIIVYIWPKLLPVPTVSFAVRYLHASAGIMITASHNPSKYNGYKVYGSDGCQITTNAAEKILAEIDKTDIFEDVIDCDFEGAVAAGRITYIEEKVLTAYIENVKKESVLYGDTVKRDAAIVYSPLNGTGRIPVVRVLKEMGYSNITLVKEQEMPDGSFPTCPYPNPEERDALSLGLSYANKHDADLVLATDPDCDRVGIAVKETDGSYRLLTGNEVGILLLDYICYQRSVHGKMPNEPVFVKTIVTSNLCEKIASYYNVRTINVLTGFKYIGEQIGILERQGKAESYIFGCEESYGYLSGTYVRDKDGVNGAFLICEMFSYYRSRGISLTERLKMLYERFGHSLNTLYSYHFEGAAGFEKMQKIMEWLRENIGPGKNIKFLGETEIIGVLDYQTGIDGLPRENVLKYIMPEKVSVVVRPSGTEPKLKIYISVCAASKEMAQITEQKIVSQLEQYLA